MKKNLICSAIISLAALSACNGAGGGGTAPIYLPAGTYYSQFTDLNATNCPPGFNLYGESGIVSNGSGQICASIAHGGGCSTLNLANNPCQSFSQSGNTVDYNNCKLTSTGMTATLNGSVSGGNNGGNCTFSATATFTNVSSSSGSTTSSASKLSNDNFINLEFVNIQTSNK